MKYFDLHCDTAYECYFKNMPLDDNCFAVSFKNGACFSSWTQTFAVWIRDEAENPFELYNKIITDCKARLKAKPSNLTPIFAVEGGAVIEKDIDRLYRLKEDGIKYLTLTWNGENRIAGGSHSQLGLTRFGKRVIKRMNKLGIACDVSHLNDRSFYRVIELAEHPLATHSNCRAVCDVPRNLTDEQIRLIAEKGGIIGLCFYGKFLGGDVFEKLYENICHLLDMGLERSIAIGSDFDGADIDRRIDKLSKIPELYCRLSEKGIKDSTLDRIFYENADEYIRNL